MHDINQVREAINAFGLGLIRSEEVIGSSHHFATYLMPHEAVAVRAQFPGVMVSTNVISGHRLHHIQVWL